MVHSDIVEKDKATVEKTLEDTAEFKSLPPAPHPGEGLKPAPKPANQVISEAPHPGGT